MILTENFLQRCIISVRRYIETALEKKESVELIGRDYTQVYLRYVSNLMYLRNDIKCHVKWSDDHKKIVHLSIIPLTKG